MRFPQMHLNAFPKGQRQMHFNAFPPKPLARPPGQPPDPACQILLAKVKRKMGNIVCCDSTVSAAAPPSAPEQVVAMPAHPPPTPELQPSIWSLTTTEPA
jgi:hypothetical protein